MPDLSATYDIPNAYGLLAADFGHDLDGYRAALGFLGDLASGIDHDEALASNGGSGSLLVRWQRSGKFARVYAKCRAAGELEHQEALRRAEGDSAATEDEDQGNPSGQTFIALEDLPATRSVFSLQPGRESWGRA